MRGDFRGEIGLDVMPLESFAGLLLLTSDIDDG